MEISNNDRRASRVKVEVIDYPPPVRYLANAPYATRLVPLLVALLYGLFIFYFIVTITLVLGTVFSTGSQTDDAAGIVLTTFEPFLLVSSVFILRKTARRNARRRHERLTQLRADTLPQRASRAAQVLQEAITLVTELQDELTARAALLEDVKRQVAETNQRAADMEALSHVDEETTHALNKYFDEALQTHLERLERGARGREWLIGTVIALLVGVGAILISHYTLGF